MDSSPASKRDKYVARVVVDQPFNYGGILPPRTIRLIRLLLGEDAEPLHFSLIEKPLDVEPGYLALSYVWGDPSETRIVYCDNREFKVTTNLYCALRQIRKNGINNFLWIDAICINQMNQEEKANQVRLMREIYKQALEVIIWLGEERDTDRSALPLMHQIHAAVQASDSEWSERVSDLDCEALGLPPFSAPSWAALWSLLQREWFSRVWVAQEYFMARSCSILCGPLHISSEVLFSVALTIRNHPNLLIQLTLYVNFSNKAIPINGAGLLALVKAKYLQGTQYDLMSLMRVTKSMRASDPRDKVFALVGIASDVPTNLIDYEKSIVEMNIEIARKYLAENEMGRKGLYLLCFVSGHRSDEKCATLPSWVPELSFHSFYVTPLTFLASLPRQAPLPQSEVSLNGNVSAPGIFFGSRD